jgi:hypothetical protein
VQFSVAVDFRFRILGIIKKCLIEPVPLSKCWDICLVPVNMSQD